MLGPKRNNLQHIYLPERRHSTTGDFCVLRRRRSFYSGSLRMLQQLGAITAGVGIEKNREE